MATTTTQAITSETINKAMNYEEYRETIDKLLQQDKTTGDDHSDGMLEYTKMNVHRMKRLDKQIVLSEELQRELNEISEEWVWLVLTEAWCGDAAQNVPVIAKMADESEQVALRFILRDENLDIMDEYLTNGGRSIPKLVCLNAETLEELGSWGPRPDVAQQKAMKWKNDPEISNKEWAENLHKWYADNKTEQIQTEFVELINNWN